MYWRREIAYFPGSSHAFNQKAILVRRSAVGALCETPKREQPLATNYDKRKKRSMKNEGAGRHVFFFSHASTFQLLLDKPCSQVLSLLPPGSCLQFLSRIGFSNPTAGRFFIEYIANSRSRDVRKSIYLRTRNSPHEFIRACTRGDSNSRN